MLRHSGILGVLVLFAGGLVWWSAPVSGSPYQEAGDEAATYTEHQHDHATKQVPQPPPGRAEGDFDLDVASKAEQKIESALKDPKGVDIEFIDTPLRDAVDFLADGHDITILIDDQSLTEEGVAIDEPINRTLSGIKLESALDIILEPLGLTYLIEDEVLKITTIVHADARRTTRVYQVGYLQQIGVDAAGLAKAISAVIEPASWGKDANPPAGEARTARVADRQRNSRGQAEIGDVTVLARTTLLQQKFAQNNNQPQTKSPQANAIQVLGDMLVISAPQSVHKKVVAMLMQLDRRWALEHGKK